jgi:hypothetical protein
LIDRLNTDRMIAPLVAQFVPLKVDLDAESWNKFRSKYNAEGNRTPIIWIIRADGQQMFGRAGGVGDNELAPFMVAQLKSAGRILPDSQLAQLADTAEAVKKAVDDKDYVSAIRRLAAVQKIGPPGSIGCYAKAAVEVDNLANQITEHGKAELAKAAKLMESPDTAVDGAIMLLEARRTYGTLPSLKIEVLSALREAGSKAGLREVMEQANLLQTGLGYAQNRDTEPRAAIMFRQVANRWPDTPAAKRADSELKKLSTAAQTAAERTAANTAEAKPMEPKSAGSAAPPSGVSAIKKAASALRMARMYEKRNPEKARQYAQSVIDTLPNSDEAEEAKRLLEGLK